MLQNYTINYPICKVIDSYVKDFNRNENKSSKSMRINHDRNMEPYFFLRARKIIESSNKKNPGKSIGIDFYSLNFISASAASEKDVD